MYILKGIFHPLKQEKEATAEGMRLLEGKKLRIW